MDIVDSNLTPNVDGLTGGVKFKMKMFDDPDRELEQYSVDIQDYLAMFNRVKECSNGKRVVDACAGTGTFSIPAVKECENITFIETDERVIPNLEYNIDLVDIKKKSHIVNKKVQDITMDCDYIICNPPFGSRTKLLKPILAGLDKYNFKEITVLIPQKKLDIVLRDIKHDHVKDLLRVYIGLGKTFDYQKEDIKLVRCFLVTLSREPGPDCTAYKTYMNPETDIDFEQLRANIVELIDVRVGSMIQSVFNGRLKAYIDSEGILQMSMLLDELPRNIKPENTIELRNIGKTILHNMSLKDNFTMRFSPTVLGTINPIYILNSLLPVECKYMSMGLIHSSIIQTIAFCVIKSCIIKWPNNMDFESRLLLAQVLFPTVHITKLRKIFFSTEYNEFPIIIQKIVYVLLKDIFKLIEAKTKELNMHELSYASNKLLSCSLESYNEFMNTRLPPLVSADYKPNKSIENITDIVKILRDKTQEKIDKKYKLEEFKVLLERDKGKYNTNCKIELPKLLEECKLYQENLDVLYSMIPEERKKTIEGKIKSKDLHTKQSSADLISDPFLPEYVKQHKEALEGEQLYNVKFRWLNTIHKIIPKEVQKAIDDIAPTIDNSMASEIDKFFNKQELRKIFNSSGAIRGPGSVATLLVYIHSYYKLTIVNKESTLQDKMMMESLLKESFEISKAMGRLTVHSIVEPLIPEFEKARAYIHPAAKDEYESLVAQLGLVSNFSHAWSIGLRLKGLMYESLFATNWNIDYIPEDCKHSLLTIIRHTMPEKAATFIKRTQKHPEVREFKPDFCLVRKPMFSSVEIPDEPPKCDESTCDGSVTTEMTKTDASDSKLYMSKGKIVGWSELGRDDLIKKHAKTSTEIIDNIIEHGAKHSSKGGVHYMDETKTTVDDNDDETQNIWEKVKINHTGDKYQIYILEVGYQTDQEGKIMSDLQKWRVPINILQSMDIEVVIMSAVDKSSQPKGEWWIDEFSVKVLSKTVRKLFGLLSRHSPIDISEQIIGDISSQKLRISLRTGSIVRPPIITADLIDYYLKWKDKINIRPTGVQIPNKLKSDFIQTHIYGATVELSIYEIEEIFDMLNEFSPNIIDEIKKHHKVEMTGKQTKWNFIESWTKEELDNNKCRHCVQKLMNKTKERPVEIRVMEMSELVNSDPSCVTCVNLCGEKPDSSKLAKNFVQMKTDALDKLMANRNSSCILTEHTDDSEGPGYKKTKFDAFVSMLLPSKTQKQTKVKNLRKALIEAVLIYNDQMAVKDSKGQILVAHNTKFSSKDTEIIDSEVTGKFSVRNLYTIEEEDEDAPEHPTGASKLQIKIDNMFTCILKLMEMDYSEAQINTVKELSLDYKFGKITPKCIIPRVWVERVFDNLNVETTPREYIRKIVTANSERGKSAVTNDTFQPISPQEVSRYLDSLEDEAHLCKPIFTIDCVIIKELIEVLVSQLKESIYEVTVQYIVAAVKLLLRFKWFNRIVLYSKICQTFMQSCSEFVHSGLKIKKIQHTDLNLVSKVTEKKSSNMLCYIADKDMMNIDQGSFFLNRRAAVLGQALPYCYLTMFIQYAQMFGCCESLLKMGSDIESDYNNIVNYKYSYVKKVILESNKGQFGEVESLFKFFRPEEYEPRTSRSETIFLNVLASFNITYGIVVGPAMALNSQSINKQVQTIRYPMMLSLSEFGFESKLGKKLFSPRRRIETEVFRCWLKAVSFVNLSDPDNNIKQWKKNPQYPNCIYSYGLCGSQIIGDRHFVYDMYLVHLYNKELDDFDQGQIRILDEFLERHYEYETSLASVITRYRSLTKEYENIMERGMTPPADIKNGIRDCKRQFRLLFGQPKLNTCEKGRNCVKMMKKHKNPGPREMTLFIEKPDSIASSNSSEGDAGSVSDDDQSDIKPESEWSAADFRTAASTGYSLNLTSGLEIIQGKATEGQKIAISRSQAIKYKPHRESLKHDIIETCKSPNYSYSSFELTQILTEYAKQHYNDGAIDRARRSPRNWQPLTSFMETTSIISEPLVNFSIKESVMIIKSQVVKKLTKLMKRKIGTVKDINERADKETLLTYLKDCMSCSSFDDECVAGVKTELYSKKALDTKSWTDMLKKPISETLLSNDANKTYFWIKTLNTSIRKTLRKKRIKTNLKGIETLEKLRNALRDLRSFRSDTTIDGKAIDDSKNIWVDTTREIIVRNNIPVLKDETFEEVLKDLETLWSEYEQLKAQRLNYPSASYAAEEQQLNLNEMDFIAKHKYNLPIIFNLLLCHILSSPWMNLLEPEDITVLHMTLADCGTHENETSRTIVSIVKQLLEYTETFCTAIGIKDQDLGHNLVKYLVSMFHSNEYPFKHMYQSTQETPTNNVNAMQLISCIKATLSKQALSKLDSDFFLTVMTMKSKNFEYTKKYLGKSGNDRQPRSTRSKVLYELAKLAIDQRQAILQALVFSMVNNPYHRNYSSLAPKAQYGGDRDLLVQEVLTKLINATSEQFAKAMLEHSISDILVTPSRKEKALEEGRDLKIRADILDGEEYRAPGRENTGQVNFFSVYCGAADHKKWGPIHSTATFNAMDMQLLKAHPDWSNYMKLVNLKSMIKQIEIPAASINKIVKIFTESDEFKGIKGKFTNESELRSLLTDYAELWLRKPHVKFLIENYLAKGENAINSYNHMGQGIHHAKSSLYGDVMRHGLMRICEKWFNTRHPDLSISIKCYGSSDDLCMNIQITGVVNKSDHARMKIMVKETVCEMLNYWTALSRACQMSLSEKSVFSSCVNEVYSDFDLYHRISPSVIKFTLSTIINSTVTTPLTLHQSVHVGAQQACYMSTSFLTNLIFSLSRQCVMMMHSEDFYRQYGWLVMRLPASFGKLYIPKASITAGGQIEVDELISFVKQIKLVLKFLTFCREKGPCYRPSLTNLKAELGAEQKQADVEQYLESQMNPKSVPRTELSWEKIRNTNLDDMSEVFETSSRTHVISQLSEVFRDEVVAQPVTMVDIDEASTSSRGYLHEESSSGGPDLICAETNEPIECPKQDSCSESVTSFEAECPVDCLEPLITNSSSVTEALYDGNLCLHRSSAKDTQVMALLAIRLNNDPSFRAFLEKESLVTNTTIEDVIKELVPAILTCVSLNYYDFSKNSVGDFTSRADRLNVHISLEDPFLHIIPEKVLSQLTKLGLTKDCVNSATFGEADLGHCSGEISRRLTEQNIKTEDYVSELRRVSQIANSRNIQCGLAGGLKDNSIPHMRQSLRSYLFLDKCGIIGADHWPMAIDKVVKSNSEGMISPKSRVKYSVWLDELLKLEVFKFGEATKDSSKSLDIFLQPKILEIVCLRPKADSKENQRLMVIFNTTKLTGLLHSTTNLINKVISENKATLINIENSKIIETLPASDAQVSKTKIFSNQGKVRFTNHPAIVISHMIDHLAASSCKPIGVNYSFLENDKAKMSTYYPEVSDIIGVIKSASHLTDEQIKKYVSTLSNIARTMSAMGLSSTPIHCFRPVKSHYEDSLASYVSLNTIEGLDLRMDDRHVKDSAFSEIYYRILEAVALISAMPISDDKKTVFLTQFLGWNPRQYNNIKITENGEVICEDALDEEDLIKRFRDEPIAVQLFSETVNIKNREDRKAVADMANFYLDKGQIITDSRKTDALLNFKSEGTIFQDGHYQLNCSYGTSCGYFMNGSLIVVMSQANKHLLRTVESQVLLWCQNIRVAAVSVEQHEKFIKLLCPNHFGKDFVHSARPMQVCIVTENDAKVLTMLPTNDRNAQCVYIKSNILPFHTYKPQTLDQPVDIKWGLGYLQMYTTQEADEVVDSNYASSIAQCIKTLAPEKNYQKRKEFREQRLILSTTKLPMTVSKPTAYLMHIFLWHKATLSEGINPDRRARLKSFFDNAKANSIKELVLNDNSMMVINQYLLSKTGIERAQIQDDLVHAITTKDEENIGIVPPVYETPHGGVDAGGLYRFNTNGSKTYMTPDEPAYEQFRSMIEQERVEMGNDYTDLPDIPSISVLRETRLTLNPGNFDVFVRSTQNEINKVFKSIDAFPFIKKLLEELNLGSLTCTPTQNPIDNKLKWKVNKPDNLKEIRLGRNIYDALKQMRSGSVPLSMSFLVFLKPCLTDYFNEISSLSTMISRTQFSRSQISAVLALILAVHKPKLTSNKFCYNWLDLLSGILPTTIQNKRKDTSFYIHAKSGSLSIDASVFIPEPEVISISRGVHLIKDNLIDNGFVYFIPVNSTDVYLMPGEHLLRLSGKKPLRELKLKPLIKAINADLKARRSIDDILDDTDYKVGKHKLYAVKAIYVDKPETEKIRLKSRAMVNLDKYMDARVLMDCVNGPAMKAHGNANGVTYYLPLVMSRLNEQFGIVKLTSALLRIHLEQAELLCGLGYRLFERVLDANLERDQEKLVVALLSSEYNPPLGSVYQAKEEAKRDTSKSAIDPGLGSSWFREEVSSDESEEESSPVRKPQTVQNIDDLFDSGDEGEITIAGDWI